LAYKRRGSPLVAGGRQIALTRTLSAFTSILALASIKGPLGPGGSASSPASLVAPLYEHHVARNTVPRAHRCWTYGPDRNQDKSSVT
jgi:hypothetical protein